VGSIFRTATAAGIEKMYLCGITPAPYDSFGRPCPKIAKVALGAEKSMAWERRTSVARLIQQLKKQEYTILCAEIYARAIPYTHVNIPDNKQEKIALVMGNEVDGLSENILKHADMILAIPMREEKESLNVSVAFGILVFYLNDHSH
jgi:tRNA G18 (ribose-2'-O)-methylase SpoU